MGLIVLPVSWSDGDTLTAGDLGSQFTAVTTVVNGNLDDDNIKASAGINPDKLSAVGGATVTDAEYRATADPDIGDAGSKASTLEGEIQRLRYQILQLNQSTYWYDAPLLRSRHNFVTNGDFRVAQRGTSFDSTTTPANSDDTVLLDRWLLLSDGNDVVDVSQETTTVPDGAYAAIKLDVETSNKKFGICHFIESKETARLFEAESGTCSLTFKARATDLTCDHLRAGVIAWSSTADTVTSDVVSAWGGAGTNPTLATNWAFENTPASLATLTTSYQTFSIENISLDTTGTTNLAVFIWTDDVTMTAGSEVVYIADVQLVAGPTAPTAFQHRPFADELRECQRFYCKTFDYSQAPADASGSDILEGAITHGVGGTGSGGADRTGEFWKFPVEMIKTPTVTTYQPKDSLTAAQWGEHGGVVDHAVTQRCVGTGGVALLVGAATTATHYYYLHAAADAEF